MKFLTKLINLDIVVCTAFVFGLIYLLSNIELNVDLIDPIGKATEDFQTSDLVYNALRDEPEKDTMITLVNISTLDRAQLSNFINKLNKHNPKVIGIDARFFKDKTQYYLDNGLVNGDSLLELAFDKVENLVLATELDNDSFDEATNRFTNIKTPLPRFMKKADGAFVNMITEENDFRVSRKIIPIEFVNDSMHLFFPVKIAQFLDKDKVDKFLNRKKIRELIDYKLSKQPYDPEYSEKFPEIIYYRGNINNFYGETDVFGRKDAFNKIDVGEVIEETFDPKLVTGKALLLGYMGETIINDKYWDEDKFYTPLNKKFAGKSFPDMYGVVVHANVVSMILNETYVTSLSEEWTFFINILICILNVILFAYIHNYNKTWWDGLSVVVALVEMVVLYFLVLILFEYYRIEFDISDSLAFIFLLGNLLELYYEYFKKWLVSFIIFMSSKLGLRTN
jgi:CHASE2 domain-containing sensor protein